ncbi:MAG: hypothetical protein GQ565_03130 [Candidatus Aegiribacteria sp.]|nr:hypothetical protein [Candidatus Aegiribacteria sp.]
MTVAELILELGKYDGGKPVMIPGKNAAGQPAMVHIGHVIAGLASGRLQGLNPDIAVFLRK